MNEYSELKKVIVGVESKFNERMFDLTFKTFYKDNLKDLDISEIYAKEYTHEIFEKRNKGLDELAYVLKNQGIEVLRPDENTIVNISIGKDKSIIRSSSNVRDTAFIFNKTIFETPPCVRGRIFENSRMYNIFNNLFINEGYNWIKAPQDIFLNKLDFENMINYNNFNINFDINELKNYNMFFDAANMIRCDGYIIYNATNYNNYLGALWLKRNINIDIHIVHIADNHIDGNIVPIFKDTFLVNDVKLPKPIECFLPNEVVEKSTFIKLPENVLNEFDDIQNFKYLASREGMSINVLSIGDKKVVCNKHDDIVCNLLHKNGFKIIEVDLPFCRAFGGGIHCSTLDVERSEND